jgi:hypothetical protein
VRKTLVLLLGLIFLAACGPASSPIPVSQLPDPAIYALDVTDLPEVGLPWQQSYDQTETKEGYRWSYNAFESYQPGNLGLELESGFAINNDVVLYETDMRRETLPNPPSTLGDIRDISWKTAPQPHQLGDRSAVWKTSLPMGEMPIPAWWLEFYQGHAYVRIGLLGFPDQIAPAILYGLGDIITARLPKSDEELKADTGTQVPTKSPYPPTATPAASPTPGTPPAPYINPQP